MLSCCGDFWCCGVNHITANPKIPYNFWDYADFCFYSCFFFGLRLAQPSSLKSGSSPTSFTLLPLKNWRQSLVLPLSSMPPLKLSLSKAFGAAFLRLDFFSNLSKLSVSSYLLPRREDFSCPLPPDFPEPLLSLDDERRDGLPVSSASYFMQC